MPRNASPGRIIGSTTLRYCRKKFAPSMRAASRIESGTAPWMYCRIQKMPNALAAAGEGELREREGRQRVEEEDQHGPVPVPATRGAVAMDSSITVAIPLVAEPDGITSNPSPAVRQVTAWVLPSTLAAVIWNGSSTCRCSGLPGPGHV